ncbi:DNA-binding protein [Betaproteobacteria bacterium]|nr:DNA-binding protein [Betaproteobacteria bacterium]
MKRPVTGSGEHEIQQVEDISASAEIELAILNLRGQRVMLSSDLAALYGVAPRVLVQAVKRNIERFPEDFMFQLNADETALMTSNPTNNLKSQFVTSSWGGARKAPYAFTEQGVAMLSSVLRSPQAVQVNIGIMRAFVRLRRILSEHQELSRRIDELEGRYDQQFRSVFEAIRQLMAPPVKEKHNPIGFTAHIGTKDETP